MAYIDYEDDETTLLPGHDRKWPDYCSVGAGKSDTAHITTGADHAKAILRKCYLVHRMKNLRRQAEYYRLHREERIAYGIEYYARHREEILARKRKNVLEKI